MSAWWATAAAVPLAVALLAPACDPNVDYLAEGGRDASAVPSEAQATLDSGAPDTSDANADALAVEAAVEAGACAPTVVANAIPLGAGQSLSQSPSGDPTYAYAFSDGVASTACLSPTALCAAGETAVEKLPTVWGAGVGFTLNQGSSQANQYAVPMTADAIGYILSDFPTQGVRLTIDSDGTEYCSLLQGASGYATWQTFNTTCWDGTGASLSGPPQDATQIQFIMPAESAAEPFDFCVESVSFVTLSHPDAGDDAALDSSAGSTDGD